MSKETMIRTISGKRTFKQSLKLAFKQRYLYLLLLPTLVSVFVFSYCCMPGVLMAFQDYSIYKGLWGSEWVGFDNIAAIFRQSKFTGAIWNTFYTSVMCIITGFPAPIILALMLHELRNKAFKRVVQTISYLPHFLSWISVVGLVYMIFSTEGIINNVMSWFGAKEPFRFLASQTVFQWFVILIPLWKGLGWSTIIHLANLTSINPELYEAAEVDGANYMQKLRHITIPHMLPTCMILLIFQMGSLFSSNFELVYGLKNPYINFDVISTVVYETGIQAGNYHMSTAIGFVQGLVALLLVLGTNWLSKKVSGTGIW
ncbi:MAG: sugar ABC transporter permease [Lachnospiraceae bacterium]|nr:sugar ABC transporter permease [Lachnospiraceae bacterium]